MLKKILHTLWGSPPIHTNIHDGIEKILYASFCNDRSYFKDITSVGTEKPLGYLPLSTIQECMDLLFKEHGIDKNAYTLITGLQYLEKILIASGKKVLLLDGKLYAYHEPTLSHFLQIPDNFQILNTYNRPSDCEYFVKKLSREIVDHSEEKDLFVLIAHAFADYNNKRVIDDSNI